MTEAASDSEILGIFPTPLMIARRVIPEPLVAAMIAQFEEEAKGANVRTARLAHTGMADPRSHGNFVAVAGLIMPKLRHYGRALMGETLSWAIKEIWINRMEPGGAQKMHNHANSFISGVIYLTECDPSAATVFHRQVGQNGFFLQNENERCEIGAYNSPIFRMPEARPGDMALFPSYMMHEVPPNQGEARMTAAFNALPERLDSWGYTLRFR
ncbi:MAG: putative 2OG-Fe(II) oxygenase [Pikeienuella sp.]